MVKGPNFLIGGAPKCGTTSMANYLRLHNEIFVSDVKEPFYFASDLPAMRESTGYDSLASYLSLFRDADDECCCLGEGSTLYLFSRVAIEQALQFNPGMKFVFMLRHPVDIAHAYHMQMVSHEFEDVTDFETAWRLSALRKNGTAPLPPRCRQPELLDYRSIASVGTQVERAARLIPKSQMLVLLFDDFVAEPRRAYCQTLDFLGVHDDGRTEFAKENSAMQSRVRSVTRLLRSRPVERVSLFLKRRLDDRFYRLARNAKHGLMFERKARRPMSEAFRAEISLEFQAEIEMVEQVLGLDLANWKNPGAVEVLP